MPTYEYACPACGIVEVFQSIKEDALTKCPSCKKRTVTRVVSGGGAVIFKGSGFWETDYNRSQDYSQRAKADAPTAAAPPATTCGPVASNANVCPVTFTRLMVQASAPRFSTTTNAVNGVPAVVVKVICPFTGNAVAVAAASVR